MHPACPSLAAGECTIALAGGVNLIMSPAPAINFSKSGALAPDGRCKTFDASADGYVRGEGVGMVVLKPLAQARADGDLVYAVIRGAAVNQDGRTNGLTAPNPQAQEAMLRAAYRKAGVDPAEVHYVEAHGTGTLLGDPIEAKALGAVLGADRDPATPFLIGSVKTNIGHLEAAAGIAGLIKAALMLQHRRIPPSLHFREPNPHIPFQDLPMRVATELQDWPASDTPATVGVSSFGFGGTNAHVVLQEAEPAAPTRRRETDHPHLLAISARTEEALRELAGRHEERLAAVDGDARVADLCFSAATRREHHEHRLACVGGTADEIRDALRAFAAGEERPGLSTGRFHAGRTPKAAFVFSGQGPHWWPLAADLIDSQPVFRDTIDHCDALLRRHTDWSLLDELLAGPETSRLADPGLCQPALCAVQIALAALWRSWGIEPAAVVGHSVGEIAAAQVAGALDLDTALRVALHRGTVIRSAAGGKMAAAGVSWDDAQQWLDRLGIEGVSVAAGNGPMSTVFSGDPSGIETLAKRMEADGVFCRVLESVGFASHSAYMEPQADELRTLLEGIRPRATSVTMYSTVTAGPIDGELLDAGYWAANLLRPVQFDRVMTALVDSGHDTVVEISPHPMLRAAVAERMELQDREGVVVTSLRRDESGAASVLGALGELYSAGRPVDWTGVHPRGGRTTALPAYPWQRQRHWLDDTAGRRRQGRRGHPMLDGHLHSAAEPKAHHWSTRVDLEGFPYLRDHQVAGTAVLPAALALDTALAAVREAAGDPSAVLEDVHFTRMATAEETAQDATLQLVLLPEAGGAGSFRLFSGSGTQPGATEWEPMAHGRFRTPQAPAEDLTDSAAMLVDARSDCPHPVDVGEHYAGLRATGLEYGAAFQGIDALWRGEHRAVARMRGVAELTGDRDAYLVHPALLDSCLQVLGAALTDDASQALEGTYLPVGVGGFTVSAGSAAPRWAHATTERPGADGLVTGTVVLYDDAGDRVATIDGIRLQRLEQPASAGTGADALLELRWEEAPADTTAATAPGADDGWWLVLADRGGVGEELRSRLADGTTVTVTAADRYRRTDDTRFEIRPTHPEDLAALFDDLHADRRTPCAGVVHAWSLDASLTDAGTEPLGDGYDLACVSVLHLVQTLARQEADRAPRLVMVTRGAQSVGGERTPADVAQAPLWGLAKVVAIEHGELRPTVVDLDPDGHGDAAELLLGELLRPGTEPQVAFRGGRRHTPRLAPFQEPDRAAAEWTQRPFDPARDTNHRILAARPGMLSSLTPTSWKRTAPGPGQVEIEVAAAGLNFSDVLKAMDLYPGMPPGGVPLGGECAGRITAVGDGVEGHRIGDAVMAVAQSGMAAFTTTDALLVAPRPPVLTDQEGAAIPIAYLTVVYGLEYLAHLAKGETVLIHSATGGVGLAALQVARRNGAEVYATAGTEEKRELLRSLGVEHVMDSRSLRFADEVMAATGGRGVDVVLNSLSGEALTRSLGLLAPHGRFVEIGKRDIYDNSHVGLGALKHNRSLFAVDLERSIAERPELIARLFTEVVRGFENGEFTALPVTAFGYTEAEDAFAYMAQARHTGKIVLCPDPLEGIAVPPAAGPVRPEATYLVTGGLGAIGLEIAKLLAAQGAEQLVLLGRGAPTPAVQETLDELRSRGTRVAVRAADVSRAADVDAVLAEIDASMPPLAGVVHSAGFLDDGLLLQLDRQRFRSVAGPKVAGAWNLHRATAGRDLDFFVLFSSAAALVGSASQGNYAAANAFLDALAQHRRTRGLPALSIDWGPWSQIGLAARPDRGGALSTQGIVSLTPEEGVAALDRLLRTTAPQVCVLPLDRDKLGAAARGGLLPGLLTGLASSPDATDAQDDRSSDIRRELLAVEPGRRRRAILVRHCRAEAARVIRADVSKVDTGTPLGNMGFDSLLSLELRKHLESSLQVELPSTITWRFPTIDALVPFLAERMDIPLEAEPAPAPPEPVAAEPPADDAGTDLDGLSDSDVEALLLAKMMQIDEGSEG